MKQAEQFIKFKNLYDEATKTKGDNMINIKKESCSICGKKIEKKKIIRFSQMPKCMLRTQNDKDKAFKNMCPECYKASVLEKRYKAYTIELPNGDIVEYR